MKIIDKIVKACIKIGKDRATRELACMGIK